MNFYATEKVWGEDCVVFDHDRPEEKQQEFVDLGYFALGLAAGEGISLEKFFFYKSVGEEGNAEEDEEDEAASWLVPSAEEANPEDEMYKYTIRGRGWSRPQTSFPVLVKGKKGEQYEKSLRDAAENLKIEIFKQQGEGLGVSCVCNLFSAPGVPLKPAECKKILKQAYRGILWFLDHGSVISYEGKPVWRSRCVKEEIEDFVLSADDESVFEKMWEYGGGLDGFYDYLASFKDKLYIKL